MMEITTYLWLNDYKNTYTNLWAAAHFIIKNEEGGNWVEELKKLPYKPKENRRIRTEIYQGNNRNNKIKTELLKNLMKTSDKTNPGKDTNRPQKQY